MYAGIGWFPAQSYTFSTDSQNLPHAGMPVAPPVCQMLREEPGVVNTVPLTKLVQGRTGFDRDGVFSRYPEEPNDHIIQGRAEHGRVALFMAANNRSASVRAKIARPQPHSHAPPAVLLVCAIEEEADELEALLECEADAGEVRADDEAGQDEHHAAVLARPVPIVRLQVPVEVEAVLGRLEGRRGRRLIWQTLDRARQAHVAQLQQSVLTVGSPSQYLSSGVCGHRAVSSSVRR
jgi:hypothetical protein